MSHDVKRGWSWSRPGCWNQPPVMDPHTISSRDQNHFSVFQYGCLQRLTHLWSQPEVAESLRTFGTYFFSLGGCRLGLTLKISLTPRRCGLIRFVWQCKQTKQPYNCPEVHLFPRRFPPTLVFCSNIETYWKKTFSVSNSSEMLDVGLQYRAGRVT